MYNLLKIEFMKLKKSKEFWLILLGICLISIGLACNDIYVMEKFIKNMDPEYYVNGLEVYVETLSRKMYPTILQSIIIIIFICKDFEKRIVQSEYLAGYSKFKILVSKVIVCFFINMILSFFFAFIRTTIISILYELGQNYTATLVFKMLRMYLLSILVRFAITTVAIMIAYIFKTTALSILVWLGVFFGYLMGVEVLVDVFESVQALQYVESSSVFQFYKMIKLDMLSGDIIYIVLMSSLRAFIVLTITYIIFRKTELR